MAINCKDFVLFCFFSKVTIENLSRNKMLPLYKREIYEHLSSEECDIVFISLKMDLTIYEKYVDLLWIRYVKTF